MTINSSFAKNFKFFRERAHIGQEALAEKIGVNVRTISVYETGKGYPKVDLLLKISQVLQVPVEHFFAEDPENIEAKPAPSLLLPSSGDDNILSKVKEYRSLLNACRQLIIGGDTEATEKLIHSFLSAVDDLENEHLLKKEIEAKLKYATDLIRSLAGGK